ncbi:MAG: 3-methyl-2-oxobutanoate hydroxymethyltransferase, partial [Deltaproteobacteria bacterium]|nr:3-methyl-2-oxobutanoate hydroxymethyltransferase [Deltaproteobacteria bacterium]
YDRHRPKFVKQYVDLGKAARDGIKDYVSEIQNGKFPAKEHSY